MADQLSRGFGVVVVEWPGMSAAAAAAAAAAACVAEDTSQVSATAASTGVHSPYRTSIILRRPSTRTLRSFINH